MSYTYSSFLQAPPSSVRVVQEVASYLAGQRLDDPHEWVEQWMIYYNKQAGHILRTHQIGILRRHREPDRERLERYRTHLPEWKHLAMSSASYCLAEEKETYHHGLETDAYAHSTSPIRRYADLVNQRALKQCLNHPMQDIPFIVPVTMYDMNRRERIIKQFAREMAFLEALQTGRTRTTAIVIEKKEVEGEWYIKYYVPEWKKTLSMTYPNVGGLQADVLTRDGMTELDLQEWDTVTLQCSSYAARRTKQRMLFQVFPATS